MADSLSFSQASDTFYGVRGHLQHLAIADAGLTLLPSFQLPRFVHSWRMFLTLLGYIDSDILGG